MTTKEVTVRRSIQQAGHCIQEALAVVERQEDFRFALEDLEQAKALLVLVIEKLSADGPSGQLRKVEIDLIMNGNIIGSIKAVRERLGLPLKEGKALVDKWIHESGLEREIFPHRFEGR